MFIISFIMNENKIVGHYFVLLGSTILINLYYFTKMIKQILKKQYFFAVNYFCFILITIAVVLKLNFEYYHPFQLLIPIIILFILNIYSLKKYKYLNYEFFPIIILGILFLIISDRKILTYCNPGFTEYNSKVNFINQNVFQGKPNSENNKQNHLTVSIKYKLKKIDETKSFGVVVCGIYKDSSWTKTQVDLTKLNQLQYYLYISEIYTRKIRKLFNDEKSNKLLIKNLKILKGECIRENNLYKYEILDNNLSEKYKNWKYKIDSELVNLKEFE